MAMPAPSPFAEKLAAIPTREAVAQVLGSRTRYWVLGPDDAAHTVLLVHGYRGDHHGLEPVIAALPGIRFISPDLPGFGDSTPMTATDHSIAGYAAWLTGFAAMLQRDGVLDATTPPAVLGHSFGSLVASRAVADGMAAERLVLVNPIASDPAAVTGPTLMALTRLFYRIGARLPERAARAWLGSPLIVQFMSMTLVTTRDRGLRRWIHEEHHRYFSGFADSRTLAEGFDASLSTQVGEVAPRIAVPTLLISGEVDQIAPLDGAERTAALFPDARLVVVDGVGHLIHYEAPRAAAAAIRGFLDAGAPA